MRDNVLICIDLASCSEMSSMKSKFGWAEDRKQGHDGNGRKYERSIKLQWKCERNRTDGLASDPNRIEASPSMKFCLQCHAAQLKPSNPTRAGDCSGRYRCVSGTETFPADESTGRI
ncbi:uncharacterized protein LOC121593626 [Anopheles merus]|uniref:uncharacterized protein LOC121593626 n=1 Tax=Anopheles merus TaxID=30066 RepID=UPI001BE459FC|nr:uncharacterized protein LOC121593626 [Anopheles merus]